MPERYHQIATSLRATGNVTFEVARDFLLQEARKAKADGTLLAAMSSNRHNHKNKMSRANKLKKFPCHSCGKLGHFRNDCPDKGKKEETKPTTNGGKPKVLSALSVNLNNINVSEKGSEVMFHDSGANDHLCNNELWFYNLKPARGNVRLPNGATEPIVKLRE